MCLPLRSLRSDRRVGPVQPGSMSEDNNNEIPIFGRCRDCGSTVFVNVRQTRAGCDAIKGMLQTIRRGEQHDYDYSVSEGLACEEVALALHHDRQERQSHG